MKRSLAWNRHSSEKIHVRRRLTPQNAAGRIHSFDGPSKAPVIGGPIAKKWGQLPVVREILELMCTYQTPNA